ncbi:MAG: branched-chain amino acid ABC transporter permease [Candidatus Magasanikbacteria bacterium]
MTSVLIHIAILICIYAIVAVSLNVTLGYTGIINLGHIAFFGVGAYTSAILTVKYGFSFLSAFLLAGVLAGISGLVLQKLINKLEGDYLALATLAFAFIVHAVFVNYKELTNGPLGIPGIPKPNLFGYKIVGNSMYLLFAFLVAAISIYIMYRLVNSRYGKLLEGVRDDMLGLQARGKDVYKLRYQSMAISAFFAGIAGSVFAHYLSYIDPTSFFIADIILVLSIVIVGGLASVRGSVVAAVVLVILPEALRFVDLPSSVIGPMRQIIYALVLLGILLYNPKGFYGKVEI